MEGSSLIQVWVTQPVPSIEALGKIRDFERQVGRCTFYIAFIKG